MDSGIKIAIGGKGGVGKTTVCAVWAQLFAEDGFDVLAIDADPNTNLASAFGIPSSRSPRPLIEMKQLIAERTGTTKDTVGAYFRLNPKVSDLPEEYWLKVSPVRSKGVSGTAAASPQTSNGVNGLKLLVLGAIRQAGSGCACPEAAFLKALLTHTILQRREMVLVDLAAGVEFMGRASIQGINVLVIVVEPGSRSIETAVNIARMARELGIKQVATIANKITATEQIKRIKFQLTNTIFLAGIRYNPAVQEADLQRKSVFQAGTELVDALREAKDRLMDSISSGKQQQVKTKSPSGA